LLHLADNRFAVSRTKSGVHDQGRLAADDDADVRDQADIEVGDGPHVIGELDGGVLADEWWRRRPARRRLRGYRRDPTERYESDARYQRRRAHVGDSSPSRSLLINDRRDGR